MMRVGCAFLLLSLAILQASGFPRVASGLAGTDWNKNPGFKARITQKGLNFLRDLGLETLRDKIQHLTIPDVSGRASVKVGHINYEVKNIRITSFNIPTAFLTTNPSAGGLRLTTSGISLSVHGNWHYKSTGFIHVSDSGSFDARASSISMALSIRVGVDSTGRPTISSARSDCSFHVSGMNVDLHGGASWLYNLFDHKIADSLKDSVNKKVCPEVLDAVNIQLENKLKTLKMEARFLHVADIDYTLVAPPVFNGSVNTAHKGEVYAHGSKTECPLPVPGVRADSDTSRMVFLWITDYLPNSAGYVLQEVGYLQYNVTKDNVPEAEKDYLNTGNFAYKFAIPQLNFMYPSMDMQINIKSTKPPVITMKENGISANLVGEFSPYAILPNKTLAYLFTLKVSIAAEVSVSFKDNNITWSLSSLSTDISRVKTEIGWFSSTLLEVAVNSAITLYFLPLMNQIGGVGVPLPQIDDLDFSNPVVTHGQNFIKIGTDLIFKE
ncbi:bactericidal permeability-increasing protein-like [Diadema setosum]|uniref:bactericidal permeability-increasing protein-like n=1 Tax=Diadema setosum TaxID=31175 RepID=UPI003B3B047D